MDALIAQNSPELAERFAGPLAFGTAGLRGEIGAGESRMNLATVTRTSRGLGQWLSNQVERPRVVVGCDARHGSHEFHRAAAEVLAAAGCEVLALLPGLPTPVTAFAVRHLRCEAGVMVTASHNPPRDNGYKVYLGGRVVEDEEARGVQLIAPADAEIASAIDAVGYADEVPRTSSGLTHVGEDVVEEYVRVVLRDVDKQPRDLPIVVTAMHGVGGGLLVRVLREAGFHNVTPVAEQQEPDPDFPTVEFPNPEEPGALDLAIATANRVGARLILAVDPDADRCSVAIPRPDTGEPQRWEQLSGDRVGALLGEEAARGAHEGGVLACSIVSSRLLERIAQRHGLRFTPTLTGFKWIGRVPGLIFGYEEAIGYCPDPQFVRDKDGIAACLRVAELAARTDLRETGLLIDATYGTYLTRPLTVRLVSTEEVAAALSRFMETPPDSLGGARVTEVADLSAGYRGLPPTPGMVLFTEEDSRVIVRPSGTEPKLKCYAEVIEPSRGTSPQGVAEQERAAQARMEALLADLHAALR
nr:phospho-sugar mutase [Corynebacterium lowii]